MIQTAEIMSQAMKRLGNINFDDLRLAAFDSNSLKMDFEKISCMSANARKHIQSAYYQQQLWIQAPLKDGL